MGQERRRHILEAAGAQGLQSGTRHAGETKVIGDGAAGSAGVQTRTELRWPLRRALLKVLPWSCRPLRTLFLVRRVPVRSHLDQWHVAFLFSEANSGKRGM